MATQPTLAQLMKLRQMQGGTEAPSMIPPEMAPPGVVDQQTSVPGVGTPQSKFDQPAPQPRLAARVIGGMQGQPGGGVGGTIGRMAMGAAQGALGPTQEPDIERERLQREQLGGQQLIEKMRVAEEDKRLQEMLAATGMRIGSQEQIAAGHDTTRLAAVGEQQEGATGRTGMQVAGRAGVQEQRDISAGARLADQIAERRYEANLKADTEKLMGTMRIEAAKQLRLLPPTQIRAMAYTAQSTMNEIPKGMAMVDALASQDKLGPLAGRWNDLIAGRVGMDDPQYMQLREFLTLNVAAALRTHFGARGGQIMFDKFIENLNAGGQSPRNIQAAMAEVADWFGGYVDMATQPGYLTGTPAPLGPEGPPKPGALKGGGAGGAAAGPWSKYGGVNAQ